MVAADLAPATKERFAFIHALRGVAALLVVWSHLSGFWLLENGKVSALQDIWYQWVARPLHIFQNGGHLGVVLFFLISGYIITHTSLRESHRSFAIRRLLRIFPPLVFATIAAWLFWLLAQATATDLLGVRGGTVWHWIAGATLVDGFLPSGRVLDVTWTLVVEMVFYALTFALLGLSRTRPAIATWAMIGLWVVLSIFAMNAPSIVQANASPIIYVGFLLVGRAIYLWHKGYVPGLDALLLASVPALLYLVFTETLSPGFLLAPGGWVGLEPILTYAYAIVIFLVLMRWSPQRVVQPFAFLGDISYSLYLLHLPVGITVLNLLDRAGVPETINTLVAIVVSIGASYAAYRFVERPFQSLARRLTRPKTESSA